MSLSSSAIATAAPPAPSRAAKTDAKAPGDEFGALVDAARTDRDEAHKPSKQTPAKPAASKVDAKPDVAKSVRSEQDDDVSSPASSIDDASASPAEASEAANDDAVDAEDTTDDAATPGLLTGAPLFVTPPAVQPVQVAAPAETTPAVSADAGAGQTPIQSPGQASAQGDAKAPAQAFPEPSVQTQAAAAAIIDGPAEAAPTPAETLAVSAAVAAIEVAQAAAKAAGPVAGTAADVVGDLLASALQPDAGIATPQPALTAIAAKAAADAKTDAKADPARLAEPPPAKQVAVDASAPATPQTAAEAMAPLESAPRLAAHVRAEGSSNASIAAEVAETPVGQTAPTSQSAEAAPAQPAAPSAAAASTSAFAAHLQAQETVTVGPVPDALPTAQTQTTAQAAPPPATPAALSLSSLSRATIDTTVQIAAQITRQLAGRSTRFEMGLTPEGLGKVNVSMDIGADGQLTARLAFDNPLAAADLRSRVDELRSQLQDAGFQVADDALSFTQQDASSSNGGDRSSDQRQSRAFASASRISAQADAAPAVPPAWVSLSLTPRGVDMKV